jgi:hypothetical protein
MENSRQYYCPKVFGGWVYLKKKAPKIVGYRKCFTHRLDRKWDWQCPVWFTQGMFANATIHSARDFDTQEDAVADMEATMKLFGVTKRTKNLNLPPKQNPTPRRAESKKGK